jgi:hypothetical protein
MNRFAIAAAGLTSALVLGGCGAEKQTACGSSPRATGSGTYVVVSVFLRAHTDEKTVRNVACSLEDSDLVASVHVVPGEPPEPPEPPAIASGLGPPAPGTIEVTPRRAQDARRVRVFVYRLPNAGLVEDVIITHGERS